MNRSNKKFVYLSFAIAAIILVGLSLSNRAKPLRSGTKDNNPSITTLLKVNALKFTKEGHIEHQLNAPKLTHHTASSKNVVDSPIIHITRNEHPWKITADKAITNKHNTKIILEGHVNIRQFEHGKKVSQLLTSRLNYYPKTQKVDTKQDITYLSQGMTVHSKGLRADLQQETMELVSHARGVYDPKKVPKKS